jgi:malate dehydrogenase (oxaloacetate-decarboxylating)
MPAVSTDWNERYNAAFIVRFRLRLRDRPGALAEALDTIGRRGGHVGDVALAGVDGSCKLRDIQAFMIDAEHRDATIRDLEELEGATVLQVVDEVMEVHRGGTIQTQHRVRLDTLMDLRMVYTPGVARVCERIAESPDAAWDYTAVRHKIAIVTNGTAVLGLGDIGPLASLPVMEGKAAILSRFVGVSAEPVLVHSREPQAIIDTVSQIEAGYGAIQLEDIAAPACFTVERGLQERLDKPVFHDDQHGTATVCVAGLKSALKRIGRRPEDCQAVVLGSGAAGSAIARFLIEFGVGEVILADSTGAIYEGRTEKMNPEKEALARITNPGRVQGTLPEVLAGRNLFVGVSRPNLVTPEMVRTMGADPIVFALANPVSEISVQAALEAGAAVAMDGRGMNNALAYPGIFRGALDVRAPRITPAMMLAAATALSEAARDQLLPDMLDLRVHECVARAVAEAA